MTEHKWAEVIRAIADGKEVEYGHRGVWCAPEPIGRINPISHHDIEWRIKPTEQEKPMLTPHIHAASMLLYAQDAAIDGEAWKNWESRNPHGGKWFALFEAPIWHPLQEYRRKPPAPKTIKVTTNSGRVYEFPEPLRVAPAKGAEYFLIIPGCVVSSQWDDDTQDRARLNGQVCHLTRAAAEKHAAALLAVNRGE